MSSDKGPTPWLTNRSPLPEYTADHMRRVAEEAQTEEALMLALDEAKDLNRVLFEALALIEQAARFGKTEYRIDIGEYYVSVRLLALLSQRGFDVQTQGYNLIVSWATPHAASPETRASALTTWNSLEPSAVPARELAKRKADQLMGKLSALRKEYAEVHQERQGIVEGLYPKAVESDKEASSDDQG